MFAVSKYVVIVGLLAHYFTLSAFDSDDTGFFKEGEIFDYQEEDQGQADQGKPSKLVAYLILVLLIACFINVYENTCLYIAITSL
jgi:hypothetical protein